MINVSLHIHLIHNQIALYAIVGMVLYKSTHQVSVSQHVQILLWIANIAKQHQIKHKLSIVINVILDILWRIQFAFSIVPIQLWIVNIVQIHFVFNATPDIYLIVKKDHVSYLAQNLVYFHYVQFVLFILQKLTINVILVINLKEQHLIIRRIVIFHALM